MNRSPRQEYHDRMKWMVIPIAILALAAAGLLARRHRRPDNRHAGKSSIMESEPLHISLFSADNVRLLSEAQIRAIEGAGEDQP